MKKMKKLLLVVLCAITVGSALEARGGHGGGGHGGRGHGGVRHGGGHGGRWHGGGWRGRGWGYGRGWGWGGPAFGIGFAPSVVVSDTVRVQRPASLDAFISEFGREPYSVSEFCNWVNATGRAQRQCDLYSAYRG